ncbi:MAG: ribonuclease P protein component [Nannocystaceae bacterium]
MRPEGFPAFLRLKKRREFLVVQGQGKKIHLRHFLVFVRHRRRTKEEADAPPTRLGITVTRKIGKAVTRNRIKRLVRDGFRRQRRDFAPGLDLVWIAKRGAAAIHYADVLAEFDALSQRLRTGGRR